MDLILDGMNEKQKIKEFKLFCKEVKSKELNTKVIAIEKGLKDTRYLLEGGGICPLVDSIAAKKVLFLFSHIRKINSIITNKYNYNH